MGDVIHAEARFGARRQAAVEAKVQEEMKANMTDSEKRTARLKQAIIDSKKNKS